MHPVTFQSITLSKAAQGTGIKAVIGGRQLGIAYHAMNIQSGSSRI